MKEYIIYFGGSWMRFFIGRFGLCVSKMENNRFSSFEILVPDAKCDFCVARSDSFIHLVCQSTDGNILYLIFDGKVWEKTILLKGKDSTPYDKYFTLLPLGNFMNLFYVINSGGKSMLIHQILDGSLMTPEVVDYITPMGLRYFAAPHITSDISLYYQNINGVCGSKIYRWSHKSFLQFVPFMKDASLAVPFCKVTQNGLKMAVPEKKEDGYQLMFYLKSDTGEIKKIEIAESCEPDAFPVILPYNNKIFVQWQDKGGIMAASTSDGSFFTRPVKYVKNASIDSKLYHIDNGIETVHCYGYGTDSSVSFYSAADILQQLKPKENNKPQILPAGHDAIDFAERAGFKKSSGWEEDPYVTQKELKEEIEKLLAVIDGYNKILDEINKKLADSE